MNKRIRLLVLAVSLTGGCGDDDGRAALGHALQTRSDFGATPATAATVDDPAAVLLTIPFPEGDPASVYWHGATDTLYIADNDNNQVWTWTEGVGLARLGTTADPEGAKDGQGTNVGQVARLADGTLLVNRFGKPGGGYGAIAILEPATKETRLVPNLDPTRKRLGLDVAADGRIFGSYFRGTHAGPDGAVTLVDLQHGETDFAAGFRKIIGVLVQGDQLFVSDQPADKIYVLPLSGPLPSPDKYTVFANVTRPDQICAGPDGSIFTGQFAAAPGSSDPIAVRQVFPDGSVKVFATDPDVSRPSGVAYDSAGRRLFVANGGTPSQRYIRVFRVP